MDSHFAYIIPYHLSFFDNYQVGNNNIVQSNTFSNFTIKHIQQRSLFDICFFIFINLLSFIIQSNCSNFGRTYFFNKMSTCEISICISGCFMIDLCRIFIIINVIYDHNSNNIIIATSFLFIFLIIIIIK